MWFVQMPCNPRIVVAIDGAILICHPKVANHVCAFRIKRANARPAMNEASCLVEVDEIPNVGRNYCIVVTWFMDAVHQYCEGHRNVQSAQVTSQCHCLRSAPTVAIDNDFGLFLFE